MSQPARQVTLETVEAQGLLAWMRQESAVRRDLTKLLVDLEPALVHADAESLARGLQETDPLLRQLDELSRRREHLIGRIRTRIGLKSSVTLKISALVQIAPVAFQKDLEAARQELKDSLRALSERTRRHTLVSRAGLDFTRRVLRVAFGEDTKTHTYDRAARTKDPVSTKSYLDQEL